MRILFFITDLGRGGAEKQLFNLISKISKKEQLELKVLSVFGGFYRKKLEDLGVSVQIILKDNTLTPFKALREFVRKVRIFKPDIVHSFLYHSNILAKVSLFFIKKDFKLICSYRSLTKKYPLIALMEFINHGNADYLVANSKRALKDLKIYKYANVPKKTIYNGFYCTPPKNELVAKLKRKYNRKKIVLTVGRFGPEKDYFTNIRTCKNLCQMRNDFLFLYVGVRDYEKYRKLAARQNVDHKIEFLGKIDYVPELMNVSSVFFLPTLYESQCNALIEAMYYNLPIVTTDIQENREIVQSAKFCPKRDDKKMAVAINKLLDKNDLNIKKNHDFVQNKLNMDRMVKSYLKLYNELLN